VYIKLLTLCDSSRTCYIAYLLSSYNIIDLLRDMKTCKCIEVAAKSRYLLILSEHGVLHHAGEDILSCGCLRFQMTSTVLHDQLSNISNFSYDV
jgi:hypothetical protein